MSEIPQLPDDISTLTEQLFSSDLGKQFSGIPVSKNIVPTEYLGKFRIIFNVQVTDTIKSKNAGKITEISYNLPKNMKLTGNGQFDLLIQTMRQELGTTKISELLGKDLQWEQKPLTELVDYRPMQSGGEQFERHYPTKFL